jgi:hypothetical protein
VLGEHPAALVLATGNTVTLVAELAAQLESLLLTPAGERLPDQADVVPADPYGEDSCDRRVEPIRSAGGQDDLSQGMSACVTLTQLTVGRIAPAECLAGTELCRVGHLALFRGRSSRRLLHVQLLWHGIDDSAALASRLADREIAPFGRCVVLVTDLMIPAISHNSLGRAGYPSLRIF